MWKVYLSGAVLMGLSVPFRAAACTCAPQAVEVLPTDGSSSTPVNTHIFVAFPDVSYNPVWSLKDNDALHDPQLIQLRLLADPPQAPQASDLVTVTRRTSGAADRHLVELIPSAPLRARTRYAVELVPKVPFRPTVRYYTKVGPRHKDLPNAVSVFTTSDLTDITPPARPGIRKGHLAPPIPSVDCGTGKSFLTLELGAAPPAADAILYAIWVVEPAAKPDYTQTPLTYVQPWRGHLVLGHSTYCQSANFIIPAHLDRIRLGVQAVDQAGNPSARDEIELVLKDGQ